MAQFRSWLAGGLRRLGNRLFRYFSDRNGARGLNRWLKLTVLGLVLSAVTCASAGKKPDASANIKTCYMPIYEPDIMLSDLQVSPNPSAGADSVKVQAKASLVNTSSNTIISEAYMTASGDTARIAMDAADGKFSTFEEIIEGYIDVSEMEPCTAWVYVVASSADGQIGSGSGSFIISEPAADSSEVKVEEDE
jgi:hypothetical protein